MAETPQSSSRVSGDASADLPATSQPELPVQGDPGLKCFTCHKVQVLYSDAPHIPCGYCLRGWFCHDGTCWNEGPCCVNHAAEVDLAMNREYRSAESLSALFPEPTLPSGKPTPEVTFTPMLIKFSRSAIRPSGPSMFPPPAPAEVQIALRPALGGTQDSAVSGGRSDVAASAYPPYRPPHFFHHHQLHQPAAVEETVQEQVHSYPVEDPTQPGGYRDSSTLPAPTAILASQPLGNASDEGGARRRARRGKGQRGALGRRGRRN